MRYLPVALLSLGILALAGLLIFVFEGLGPAGEDAPDTRRVDFVLSDFQALEGWSSDDQTGALTAFVRSCGALPQADDRPRRGFRLDGDTPLYGVVGDWRAPCEALPDPNPTDPALVRAFFETHFTPVRMVAGSPDETLFTGYFEPEYPASETPDTRYTAPLYTLPDDLLQANLGAFSDDFAGRTIVGRLEGARFVPYHNRQAIEAGALEGKSVPFVYLANPVDSFFLHIQGSGRLRLPDGRVLRVGYAGKNGRAYVPIGRVLRDQGALEPDNISMQTIRGWLEANPGKAPEVMNANPSYVFFRPLDLPPTDGPIGAQGVPLTDNRSLAVDRRYHALGVPMMLETAVPVDGLGTRVAFTKLMIAQDTGGAIRGPIRGDVFFGSGSAAGELAGRM
ncbi:MAG: MltA domain-containing protein, partial [Pseudomonadota bacterium]